MSYPAAITTLVAIVFLAGAVIAHQVPGSHADAAPSLSPLHMTIPDNLPVGTADTSF
jgi:hypothetical protein